MNYRVQDKENVHYSGRKTGFTLFERVGRNYVYVGKFYTSGWDRTDEQCIAAALRQLDGEQE